METMTALKMFKISSVRKDWRPEPWPVQGHRHLTTLKIPLLNTTWFYFYF